MNNRAPLSANVKASLYMMLSMMGFVINDTFVKSLGDSLGVGQIMAVRGALLSLLLFTLLWQQGLLHRLRELLNITVGMRSLMEVCATLTFLYSLHLLPFATISAILQALPLSVALGAAIFLNEPVGWRRWLAIAIGFCGVLVIIRPGLDGFNAVSLIMLLSVGFAAARDLFTRKLPPALPSLLVSTATATIITLAGTVLATAQGNWRPVSGDQLLTLMSAAFFLFFGYQFIVMAMRTGEVAYVVPFRYTSLLWAIALGYLVFAEVPDAMTLIGSAIVVATGLFTLYREVVNNRAKFRTSAATASRQR
jgi:drug/metabolite transporter (DMT)-like permease